MPASLALADVGNIPAQVTNVVTKTNNGAVPIQRPIAPQALAPQQSGSAASTPEALASPIVESESNKTVSISDKTKITFIGVSSASALTGHIFSTEVAPPPEMVSPLLPPLPPLPPFPSTPPAVRVGASTPGSNGGNGGLFFGNGGSGGAGDPDSTGTAILPRAPENNSAAASSIGTVAKEYFVGGTYFDELPINIVPPGPVATPPPVVGYLPGEKTTSSPAPSAPDGN